ncbi:MAG: hypothetical protein A3B37_03805 [Candidatus Sungbacteria bacterium RIFCSPLOWO2_01_FULL_59_16]|uniref:Prepilin-type N-terminal cleavage/methylation domain-containing protein n=1 Tax=Candidatus Sungbacteria bacterium RIFCSPLOWO2_01_FULL_59_16 TaxID=1802280 RepID=A0A1G2L934_9BACT|nr:MAG: hypothetical protein A3B37_03805 [Candidatus Sungbacteria bacterium RIFCSPLOWO2_01_FULL_59_16]
MMNDERQILKAASRNDSRLRRHSLFSIPYFLFPLPQERTGFTLVETVVALAVITGALVGPFLLSSRSIFNARYAKSRLIAANLAQEGIEIIRSYRDNNVLAEVPWDTGLAEGDYRIDVICVGNPCSSDATRAPNFQSCSVVNCNDPIRFDAATGLYSYDSAGLPTGFQRTVTIDRQLLNMAERFDPGVAAAQQMFVKSAVTWTDGRVSRTMQVEEILYDWR